MKMSPGNMPKIGLEPTYLSAPEPKSGVSTNSTTWALVLRKNLVGWLPFVKRRKRVTY